MKDKIQDSLREKLDSACCPRSETPRAPIFNLVDDTDLDQGKLAKMISEAWQIETGFTNAVVNAYARVNLAGIVDDMNEKHLATITEMVQGAGVERVVLKCYLDTDMLANRSLALDNTKIKSVVGWHPKVEITRERLDEIVDRLRELKQFPQRDYC